MSKLLFVALATTTLTSIAGAQATSAEWIDMPFGRFNADVTPDGRWIVGTTTSNFPFRFDTEAATFSALIGGTDATGISDDGTIVVGCMTDPVDGEVAGMWTTGTNTWASLGFLPNALSCPSRSNAYDVSADGTVVTGLSWDGCSGRAFRWTQATGMEELEALANGGNRGTAISADGTVMAGFAQGSSNRTPAMWDGTTLNGDLLDPPNGDVVGEMYYVSDDGSELYGSWAGDAVRWTAGGGPEVIGQGSVIATWTGIPTAVADDGTVVGFDIFLGNRRAWIQPQGKGDLLVLQTYIESLGATVSSPTGLEVAVDITPDGKTIIGHGFPGAWRINLEYPSCTGDIDDSGEVEFNDLLTILSNWGTDGPGADVAEPTNLVDFSDLLVILSAWGPCP